MATLNLGKEDQEEAGGPGCRELPQDGSGQTPRWASLTEMASPKVASCSHAFLRDSRALIPLGLSGDTYTVLGSEWAGR